jgi:hypothetical protein
VALGERMFTAGGTVSPEAVLKKAGKSLNLEEFQVGDRVTIKWKATEQGCLILLLKERQGWGKKRIDHPIDLQEFPLTLMPHPRETRGNRF